ncbi:MAG: ester cyclase [Deltaproteobacteria bacterium]|nr:ester cyclase [Deltaproteobacteria bacterium]
MDPVERFAQYALAFEHAFASDDWSVLPSHFTADATYETYGAPPLAGRAAGRAAVVERLRGLVDGIDRRFDRRAPAIVDGPRERDGGVWMRFALTLERDGLSPLTIHGDHTVLFDGPHIARIEEYVPARDGAAVEAYLAQHAARLHPPRGTALPLSVARMEALVSAYAAAKSRADIDAALAVCSDDFQLETVALHTRAQGADAARAQLGVFFTAFPDYAVRLEGLAAGDTGMAAWGRARLSFKGPLLEIPPTGRTAELPIFCVFGFRGDRIASERFVFDLADLCAQTGLPLELLSAMARGNGSQRAAAS